jgi:hypothetical protein
MRTTDNPWPEPVGPLGDRVAPQKPKEPEWHPYRDRDGNTVKGVEENGEGKIRTAPPLQKYPRRFPI